MDEIMRTLEEHRELLEILGYELNLKNKNYMIFFNNIQIIRNNKMLGNIYIKEENLKWLKENKVTLANERIECIRLNSDPRKNTRVVFHVTILDNNFRCNCYNLEKRNYIALENKKIKIKKHTDYIKIEVRDKELKPKYIVNYPDRDNKSSKIDTEINNIFGFNVINNIENYYKNKTKQLKK